MDYPGEVSNPTADLTTGKLHVNSVMSDIITHYMCMDVKKFYLNNHTEQSERIVIHMSMNPKEFITDYNLKDKVHNGYIFSRVTNSMYELPQAGSIVHDYLV